MRRKSTHLVLLGLHLKARVAERLLERHAVHQERVAQAATLRLVQGDVLRRFSQALGVEEIA